MNILYIFVYQQLSINNNQNLNNAKIQFKFLLAVIFTRRERRKICQWSQDANKGGAVLDPTLIPIRKTNKGLIVHHSEVSAALTVGSSPHQHANTGGGLSRFPRHSRDCIQAPSYNLLLRDETFTSSHSKHTLAG